MKNNYLAFIVFAILLVVMTAVTGNYVYAALADFFFLGAYLSYRKQRRSEAISEKEVE